MATPTVMASSTDAMQIKTMEAVLGPLGHFSGSGSGSGEGSGWGSGSGLGLMQVPL